jgi:5-oxoprolinase (ATP-hydrolysing)
VERLPTYPTQYPDAPTEGIRRILEEVYGEKIPIGQPVPCKNIASIRCGTTVATNALLERKGVPTALVTTSGFRDILEIGNQSRPKIFELCIQKPELIYQAVVEVDERVRVVHANSARMLLLFVCLFV